MGGIAIVFPGQGTQAPGMGRSLYETSPAARRVFEAADAVRPGTSEMCFAGSPEELKKTINTQPSLWVVEMAAAAALAEAGVGIAGSADSENLDGNNRIKINAAAGFSLGELAALTYAGAVDFETGFRILCRRAELMDTATHEADAVMAAVMKLDGEAVEQLCDSFEHIWPVNYNCPGQTTVAGLRDEMEHFVPAVKEAGGLAKLLKVSGAFHSPLMENAADKFGEDLEKIDFAAPKIELYSNYTGSLYSAENRNTATGTTAQSGRSTIADTVAGAKSETIAASGSETVVGSGSVAAAVAASELETAAEPKDASESAAAELLTKQICNPVRWQTTIENMAASGVDTFIEAGPGRTLGGLIKRILPKARILSVEDEQTLAKTLEVLQEC